MTEKEEIQIQSLSFADEYWNKITNELREHGEIPENAVLTEVSVSVAVEEPVSVSDIEYMELNDA